MKKIVAILLASLILISNVGFAVSNHYCGGMLASSSLTIGHVANGCGMEKAPNSEKCVQTCSTLSQRKCCENVFQDLEVENDFSKSADTQVSLDPVFAVAFAFALVADYFTNDAKTLAINAYIPPDLRGDTHIVNQVFRL
jgi:hypothetical protein